MRKLNPFLSGRPWAIAGSLLFFLLFLNACDREDAPDCFRSPGGIIQKQVDADPFKEVIVYGKIKLFLEQGEEQGVIIESGKNIIEGVTAEVENGRLSIRDKSNCSFFRETHVTNVYVTTPDLTWVMNASNKTIESLGLLKFPLIRLRSNNNQNNPEIYTNGDFKLELESQAILLDGDDFSNFYISGKTAYLSASFWAGDGRLEAAGLEADSVKVFHRGTNKMIVNPQLKLEGEIRSTGDVISVTRPPEVNVQTYYTGKLVFEE